MKKLIIFLLLLLTITTALAEEKIVVNPKQKVTKTIETVKVKTDDGIYRIFVVYSGYGTGISVIKINEK